MSRNVDKLADMFPGVKWHKLGDKYVGKFGDQTMAFNGGYTDALFEKGKRKNSTQKAVERAVEEMKAKTWNSNEDN